MIFQFMLLQLLLCGVTNERDDTTGITALVGSLMLINMLVSLLWVQEAHVKIVALQPRCYGSTCI